MSHPRIDAVSAFIASSPARAYPPEVLDAARQCIVDWAASAIAGLSDRNGLLVRDLVRGWRSHGRALTLYGERTSAAAAALVNGTLAHALDYDDLHLATATHLSAPAIAAVLALGMERGASERAMLEAFIVGFEVGAASGANDIGLTLGRAGWNPSGILGHFSAVGAAAALLRLDTDQVANAFGITATQVSGLVLSAGTTAKPFQIGKAAMNAVLAAELAAQGADGAHGIFDQPVTGVIGSLVQQPLVPDFGALGRVWEITRNSFKPYACCQLAHAPFEAGRALRETVGRAPVRRMRVYVNPFAITIAGKMHPKTATEAKFSVAYCAALGLAGHRAVPDDFSPERLAEPGLMALADTVELVPTESMARWAARIEAQTDTGVLVGETQAAAGSLECPLGWADLDAKFMAVAAPIYGHAAGHLLGLFKTFDVRGRMTEIARVLEARAAAA